MPRRLASLFPYKPGYICRRVNTLLGTTFEFEVPAEHMRKRESGWILEIACINKNNKVLGCTTGLSFNATHGEPGVPISISERHSITITCATDEDLQDLLRRMKNAPEGSFPASPISTRNRITLAEWMQLIREEDSFYAGIHRSELDRLNRLLEEVL